MSAAPEMVHYDGSAVEQRAEVASLDDLQQTRRFLLQQLAPLKALHGPFGAWDAKRKVRLEAAKIQARLTCEANGTKITEALIDAMGHADEGYAAFIDQSITDKTQYLLLENELTDVNDRIESRLAELYVYNRELALAR